MIKKTIIHGCEARGDGDNPYLTRYTLFESKAFQICIHIFHRSDSDEHHDHPWNFITIPLWRGYKEETTFKYMEVKVFDENNKLVDYFNTKKVYPLIPYYRPATHRHRVILYKDKKGNEKKAVTLVFMGKRIREWGFFTKEGWLEWRAYFFKNRC